MRNVIFKKASYEYEILKPVLFEMMDAFGKDLIAPKSRVLIKPNLLSPAGPEKAVVTHPLVVRAVAEYVLEKGGRPQISDSPALGSFERFLKEGGFQKALEDLDVEFMPFQASVKVDIGDPFGSIDLAKDAVGADVVINLAKLKTHTQMLLTLGVKNLFGCIVGFRKPEWHLRCGADREMFARLLVQVYQAIRPPITIIDGILAMQGQGPGKRGTPRHIGILAGGSDAFKVDRAVCSLLGLDPKDLPTHRAAKTLGLADDTVHINGDFDTISDFKFPVLGPLTFGPKPLHGLIRKHLLQRPVVDDEACELCGECGRYCPATAIASGEERIEFDYDKCIRCYCCVEICPHGALQALETWPGRILRRLALGT